MVDENAIPELKVPKSIVAPVGASIMPVFVLSSVALAIHDLLNRVAIIPSLIWLFLVGWLLIEISRSKGHKRFAIEILGGFSLKEFVQIIRKEDGQNDVRFGYKMFGRRFYYLAITAYRIEHLNWSTGQASSLAGRDVNDWSVALWYDHQDPAKSRRRAKWKYADQSIYIVGPSGSRRDIEPFGLALLNYLRQAGATLVPGENECVFVRPPCTPKS